MNQYLLDTDICVYFIKGLFNLEQKIKDVGLENCCISVITAAELKYGVENSDSSKKEQNRVIVHQFINSITQIPLDTCLDFYASEKARLRRVGQLIDDFDLLIGSTAIADNRIMVTNNARHFNRITGIQIENWVS